MTTPGKIVQIAVTSGGEDNVCDVVYALDENILNEVKRLKRLDK